MTATTALLTAKPLPQRQAWYMYSLSVYPHTHLLKQFTIVLLWLQLQPAEEPRCHGVTELGIGNLVQLHSLCVRALPNTFELDYTCT